MEITKIPTFKISGSIGTDFHGINTMSNLFAELSKYRDTRVNLDFYGMKWMDANLFAYFNACAQRLIREQNLVLVTDMPYLKQNFKVFFRSGAIGSNDVIVGQRDSTVPFRSFFEHEVDSFFDYNKEMMAHDGFPALDPQLKKLILNNLVEVFQNIRHAKTSDPLYACGQYYPQKEQLKLTLVDLGKGFLEPIRQHTDGKIITDLNAIEWAVGGNSSDSKSNVTGGYALQSIKKYCSTGQARMQIYSGNGFWDSLSDCQNWGQKMTNSPFKGSMINLIFNHR